MYRLTCIMKQVPVLTISNILFSSTEFFHCDTRKKTAGPEENKTEEKVPLNSKEEDNNTQPKI